LTKAEKSDSSRLGKESEILPIKRKPTHPGEILKEEFLILLNISRVELAQRLGTAFRTINEIINEKRGITPEMALKLARFLGPSEELWFNLQNQYDLYKAKEKGKRNN
jgi:addiction module HigA family antidote